MSRRDRTLITILLPVAAIAAFWMLALSPKISDMHKADDQLVAARTELAAANDQLAKAKTTQVEMAKQRSALAAADRAVPATSRTPDLLRQLQRTAERAGVSVDSVSPAAASATGTAAPSPVPGVDASTVNLTFSGSFAQTQRFLRRLGRLTRVTPKDRVLAHGRLVSINSVTLAPDSESKKLTANVSASVYTLQNAAAMAAAAAAAAPATGAAPASGSGS